jgi:hypothetical protein
MSDILRRAVIPNLEAAGTPYLLDPKSSAVVLPFEAEHGMRFLLYMLADDERAEVTVSTTILEVPPQRRSRVALLLAELNTQYRAVTFSMAEGTVYADACIDLAHCTDAGAMVRLASERLMCALSFACPAIAASTRGRKRRPKVLREVEQILANLTAVAPE